MKFQGWYPVHGVGWLPGQDGARRHREDPDGDVEDEGAVQGPVPQQQGQYSVGDPIEMFHPNPREILSAQFVFFKLGCEHTKQWPLKSFFYLGSV